ncbi:MAG: C45 family peptidase [Candidatus Diapherotrites archaeon]|nr:C45 family peptidase [Candidatus Diapherotrites archaeon]
MAEFPKFEYLKAKGDNLEIGRIVGKAFGDQIVSVIEYMRSFYLKEFNLSFDQAFKLAESRLSFVKKELPQFVEELQGMAQGIGISFNDLFLLNSDEFLYEQKFASKGCTDVFLKTDGLLVGHTEDWLADFGNRMFILEADVSNKFDSLSFIALTYFGRLPGYSANLNSHGFASTSNGVHAFDFKPGVPKAFVNRYVLESGSMKEAVRKAGSLSRASGGTLNLVQGTEFASLELSANQFELLKYSQDRGVHTNHFISSAMNSLGTQSENSIKRLERANQMLNMVKQPPESFLHSILADHENAPHSICSHSADLIAKQKKSATLGAVMIDPSKKRFSVLTGSPCRGKFIDYYLK